MVNHSPFYLLVCAAFDTGELYSHLLLLSVVFDAFGFSICCSLVS
jgi:hypothetical protein